MLPPSIPESHASLRDEGSGKEAGPLRSLAYTWVHPCCLRDHAMWSTLAVPTLESIWHSALHGLFAEKMFAW